MRLDKFLVSEGLGSRTEVKQLLKKKQIMVNGKIETSAKCHIDEYKDVISYNRQELTYEKYLYYMLNKPKGVISATEDAHHKTVLDLLETKASHKQVFPVGRLDIDTHGLLLLTNNGALAHAMLSPKKHVTKTYRAQVSGLMTDDDKHAFQEGISLKEFTCLPSHLEILERHEENKTSLVDIAVQEGKFHQVKRMVAACGKEVMDLQRLSMGPLTLDSNLSLGEWRPLKQEEIEALRIFQTEL